MKKVLALVLALTLFTVPLCTAAAAGTDLSGMTNEELTALKEQLDAEMTNRRMVKTAVLPMGTYTIGVDISQGDYMLINDVDGGATYCQYASNEDLENGIIMDVEWLKNVNTSARVVLTDGQILQITGNTLRITPFSVQWQ